jgi:hypothetical protein
MIVVLTVLLADHQVQPQRDGAAGSKLHNVANRRCGEMFMITYSKQQCVSGY